MSNNCKPCKNPLIEIVTSNPQLNDIIDLITQGMNTNEVVLEAGKDMKVEETVDGDTTTYVISYNPYIPLNISSFTDDIALQVKGSTVASFTLNWTYNKDVISQSLNQGLTAPNVQLGQTSYTLPVTGQAITSDTTITLTADDIAGDNNAAKTSNVSILFANYIYQTQLTLSDRTDIVTTDITDLDLNTVTKVLSRNKNITFNCVSDSSEYEVIMIPTSYGAAAFKDVATNLTGGWGKVFTVSLTNEEGFAEDYDIYVAINKYLEDFTFQII